jgi:2-methylisocitrate lyase-like PEP mutase family enzyme
MIILANLFLLQTGAGTSMSRLGWADLGMATLNDMKSNAEMIASLDPSVPLIADADTGYGGPIMVSRTVTQYARAGVAALHVEDQVILFQQTRDRAHAQLGTREKMRSSDGQGDCRSRNLL